MIVAKTCPAAAHLSAKFTERQLEKRYLALVGGKVAKEEDCIDRPLVKIKSSGLDLMRPATVGEADFTS